MNVTDYIIVAVIVVSTIISLSRGFVKELISLIIWILAFWVSIHFYSVFAIVLEPFIANEALRHVASFASIFLLSLIIGALFSRFFSFLVIKTGLSGTDRMLGMVFGGARGVLLVAIFLLMVSTTSFVEDMWWQQSILIPNFEFVVDWLKLFLPEKMTGFVETAVGGV